MRWSRLWPAWPQALRHTCTGRSPAAAASATARALRSAGPSWTDGVTHILINDAGDPQAIAVDSAHVYWFNIGTDSIGRANLDGSDPEPQWIPNVDDAGGIALSSSYIYWTDDNANIARADIDGTNVDPTFITTGAHSDPDGLAIIPGSPSTLYFTEGESIMSAPATAGANVSTFYAPGSGAALTGLAAADGRLFWVAQTVSSASIGTATVNDPEAASNDFVTGLDEPQGIATDGTYVYWSDREPDAEGIGRAAIGDGITTTPDDDFISEPGGPGDVAVDAGIDPTTTSVSCLQPVVAVAATTTCTASVTDAASSSPPSGTVSFSGSAGTVALGNPCTLGSIASVETCTVGIEQALAGTVSIVATYSGDPVHQGSGGSFSLCAGRRSSVAVRRRRRRRRRRPPPPLAASFPSSRERR